MFARLQIRFGLALLLAASLSAQSSPAGALTAVRFWTFSDSTRVVVETTADFEVSQDRVPNPDRLFFDLKGTEVKLRGKRQGTFPVNDPRLHQIRVAETQPGVARVVFDLGDNVEFSSSRLTNPPRLIVELRSAATLSQAPSRVLAAAAPALTSTETRTTATSIAAKTETPPLPPPKAAKMETQSMVRALGLKVGRIVLDPGHGGHDTGTSGPKGLLEKDLVLDVSKRLGALIESRMGAEVVYTRSDDTFIPLERRTEIANEEKADLFLSIHANSSPAASSSGVETYYLNFTDDKSAMQLAARENAGSSKTVYELKDLLQRIALHEKIEESRQFAARVHHSLFTASARANSGTRDRGVRKAPFIVLIGASMPSVLAEIGFVTNPRDEALFRKEAFRQKIAEGLYQGIARYASTLSQFQVAQK